MAQTSSLPGSRACRAALAAAALLLGLPLAGCKTDGLVTGTTYPNDYRLRHPIALTNAPTSLDLFVGRNAAGLDARQAQDLRQFVGDFRTTGQGPMTVLVPRHSAMPGNDHRGAVAVRSALAGYGLSGRALQVSTYEAGGNGALASPVRLTFVKLQAQVASQCGDFTQDLGGFGIDFQNWQNKPHINSGCAYQTAIAAQVDNPLDFQRPRAEERPDVLRRMKVFDDARKGTDPSTAWKTGTASVSGTVGSGSGGQ